MITASPLSYARQTRLALGLAVLASTNVAAALQGEDFKSLAERCAPAVASETMAALVGVESSFNPYAIGVVGGRLERQPRTKAEAIATAKALEAAGQKYSAGIAQVFRGNWQAYGLTHETAFEACPNLRAGSSILQDCFQRAKRQAADEQLALRMAFSCYYSNNFTTGFRPDHQGQPSYVEKVLLAAAEQAGAPVVPPIRFIPSSSPVAAEQTNKVEKPARPAGPETVDFDALAEPAQKGAEEQKAEKAPTAESQAAPKHSPYVYPPDEASDAQRALVY